MGGAMSLNRRTVVKAIATGGALIGASVLTPRLAMAAWNLAAFGSEKQLDAMHALLGDKPTASDEINLKVPRVVENGAIVPVTVRTDLDNVDTISLFVEGNSPPLPYSGLVTKAPLLKPITRHSHR